MLKLNQTQNQVLVFYKDGVKVISGNVTITGTGFQLLSNGKHQDAAEKLLASYGCAMSHNKSKLSKQCIFIITNNVSLVNKSYAEEDNKWHIIYQKFL